MKAKEEKPTRLRSPNFPSLDLKDAIEKIDKLYTADKMAGSMKAAAINRLGYSGVNGASLGVLAALKKFDLIRYEANRIFVTDRARYILLQPESDKKRQKYIKECALMPEIYKVLWDKYKGNGLPSDATLRTELVFGHGFNENAVTKFINDFKATVSFAGLDFEDIGSYSEEPIENINEMNQPKSNIPNNQQRSQLENVSEYKIPRKNNKLAVLTLESPVSRKDIESISKWLELLQDTIVDEETSE